ncbi:uncharacterized protein K452DRAFT_238173 [Aplosporella prunicola CBS 121167]|uniref:Sequence orphan n=1 Tax=Aplosporella prunicola CBS 121167 TaxID=1176127 RepID=A0A6A6B024_9PEZI|nr:uncharacterized protein K452DRAFT_238173 [Aplosporella prunicola CBS 121167]KAF2136051.1 hypothetical protein K452DRAFT_238173 [Aplosporella prunicola CBS 121167]
MQNLVSNLAADALAATCAATLLAPIITVIDKSVVESTAHGIPLQQSWRNTLSTILRRPGFLLSKPFLIMHGLYLSTYMTANTCDTIQSLSDTSGTMGATTKFAAVSIVNMSYGIYKDTRFAAMFGPRASTAAAAGVVAPRRPVPLPALSAFFVRDTITIFACFNLPPLLAPYVPDALAESPQAKRNLTQLLCPAAIQLVSTPLHLVGLDLYNRPLGQESVGLAQRLSLIRRHWGGACLARIGRIVPAFGIGGIVNANLREKWRSG